MYEPRIGKDVDDDDLVWIGLHKDSAMVDYLKRTNFDNADVDLFREAVILQDELDSIPGNPQQPSPYFGPDERLTSFIK